jgi:predicted RNase H-like HicB family nuclease
LFIESIRSISEICTFGATFEEAREMVEDAIRCYLESAIKELARQSGG